MRSLKSHISLTLALFAILFSVQTFLSVIRIIDTYENRLENNYAMIVVSHADINASKVIKVIKGSKSFSQLESDVILDELSLELDKKQINLLKATLPHFYELKLDHFPKPDEIKRVQSDLLQIKGIFEVESFSKRHDQVFRLLLILKTTINIFGIMAIIIGLLLILKEMRLWQYAHQNRMHIMALFGAPVWLRSAVLFRFAFLDALFATVLTSGVFLFLDSSSDMQSFLQTLQVKISLFEPLFDIFYLLAAAFISSLSLALMLVLRRPKAMHS